MVFKIEVKSEGRVKIKVLLRHGPFQHRGIVRTQKKGSHNRHLTKGKRKHLLAEMSSLTSDSCEAFLTCPKVQQCQPCMSAP